MEFISKINGLSLLAFCLMANVGFTEEMQKETPATPKPQGWSLDIGGTYTWISFTTPPTYRGSTGGVQGKVTYQKPWEFFGQARSFYNLGRPSSSENKSRFYEWYTEFVGGYSLEAGKNWSFTPYAGLGMEFLHDNHSGYGSVAPIQLRYTLYYAIGGFDMQYSRKNWMVGLQADCLPTFNQYLRIKSLTAAAWVLKNRVGASARLPVAYRFFNNYWLELAPYFRFMPIGASNTLELSHRNLSEWGTFLTFRFFL